MGVKVKFLQKSKSYETLQEVMGNDLSSIIQQSGSDSERCKELFIFVWIWGTAGTQHSMGPDIFVWVHSNVADPAVAPAANSYKRQQRVSTYCQHCPGFIWGSELVCHSSRKAMLRGSGFRFPTSVSATCNLCASSYLHLCLKDLGWEPAALILRLLMHAHVSPNAWAPQ